MSDKCWCGGDYIKGTHLITFSQEEKIYIEVDAFICTNCQQPSQKSLDKVDMVKLLEEARSEYILEEQKRLRVLRREAERSKDLGLIVPERYKDDVPKYIIDFHNNKVDRLMLFKNSEGIRLSISYDCESMSTRFDRYQLEQILEKMDELER